MCRSYTNIHTWSFACIRFKYVEKCDWDDHIYYKIIYILYQSITIKTVEHCIGTKILYLIANFNIPIGPAKIIVD